MNQILCQSPILCQTGSLLTNLSLSVSYCTSVIVGPKATVTHLLPHLLTTPMCGQWGVQRSEPEHWLCFSVGFYSMWPCIRTSILFKGAIPQDLHKSLILSIPIEGKILWHSFNSLSYWGMHLRKCRPFGLFAQDHSDWLKHPRDMWTILMV